MSSLQRDAQIMAGIVLRQWPDEITAQSDDFLAGAVWVWTGLDLELCRQAVHEVRKEQA